MGSLRPDVALTFDDVLLVPAHSTLLPRDVALKTKVSRRISLNTAPSVALSEAITMLGSMPTPCMGRPSASWIST